MNDEKKIAQAILDASELREDSWKVGEMNGDIVGEGYYDREILECLSIACKKYGLSPGIHQLLFLAAEAWWNDTIIWAEKVLANPVSEARRTQYNCIL